LVRKRLCKKKKSLKILCRLADLKRPLTCNVPSQSKRTCRPPEPSFSPKDLIRLKATHRLGVWPNRSELKMVHGQPAAGREHGNELAN
jgi:hypothetical protein